MSHVDDSGGRRSADYWMYMAGQVAKILQGVRTSRQVKIPKGILNDARKFMTHAQRGLGWRVLTTQEDRTVVVFFLDAVEIERTTYRKRHLSLREYRLLAQSVIRVLEHVEKDGRFFGKKQQAHARRIGRIFWQVHLRGDATVFKEMASGPHR